VSTGASGVDARGRRVAWWLLLGGVTGAVLAPLLVTWAAPGGVEAVDLASRRVAPGAAHWFGTDDLGRDVLARVLVGARVSLAIGLVSAVCSAALGVAVGSAAALGRPWVDDLLMRATDAMLAIPRLPLLMLAAAVLRPGVPLLVVLVAATGWMEAARVARAAVASLAAREYVAAARAAGSTPWRVWRRHLLPGVLPVATVATTLAVGRGILLESTLSFFGVGVQPPAASWGNMLYQAQATMASAPWLAVFPGACIFATVLACTVAADGVGEGRRPVS
jgi:peptide/nickel transport system permease protein